MSHADIAASIDAAVWERRGRRSGRETIFLCPAHDDTNPSAEWNRQKGTWHCFSCGEGGSWRDLAERLGIRIDEPRPQLQPEQTYDYRDEDGKLLFQVCRMAGKKFRQRRPDGAGGWVWNLEGVRRVLYRLPELRASDAATVVFLVEGEKDVEAIRARGGVATCNPQGAGKWRKDYADALAGRAVVVLPDNDDAGRKHADDVTASLYGRAASLKVLELPMLPKKGDVSDWFEAGGTFEELLALAAAQPEWKPTEGGSIPATFPCTDAGNGEMFAHLYGDRVRYDWARGRWLVWQGHRWGADMIGELQRLGKDAARRRWASAAEIDSSEERSKVGKWANQSESRSRIESMLALARSEPPIADTGKGWDANPLALGVENGVVNLANGGVKGGEREERITLSVGIPYDPDAECPLWLRFLDEVFGGDQELIAYIKRAVGYSLTGRVSEQVLFLCHGKGANGKSTFLGVLRALLGEYAGSMAFQVLEKTHGGIGGAATPDLAALAGKRVITSIEAGEAAGLNEARVKAITGGDPITARALYQAPFTFEPAFKLWLGLNHLPRVADDSDGFWRRIHLVPFSQQFEGERRDDEMEAKLKRELPGILRWAIDGAMEWCRDGLKPPLLVHNATFDYRQESDPLAAFIAERCIETTTARAKRSDLYKAYRTWATDSGLKEREQLGEASFGRRLGERYKSKKSNGVRFYEGLGLRGDNTAEPPLVASLSAEPPDSARDATGHFARDFEEFSHDEASRKEVYEPSVPSVPSVPVVRDLTPPAPGVLKLVPCDCGARAQWDAVRGYWQCRQCWVKQFPPEPPV